MRQKMSDSNSESSTEDIVFIGGTAVTFIVIFIWSFFYVPPPRAGVFVKIVLCFLLSFSLTLPFCLFWACIAIVIAYFVDRDRSKTTLKSGDVLDNKTPDIYTPTLKQLDTVTPISNIEEVGKYAECPYCGSNIRETFNELGGIVRCDKCGAFHHRECFEYYGLSFR